MDQAVHDERRGQGVITWNNAILEGVLVLSAYARLYPGVSGTDAPREPSDSA